jgi:8-oxo-dGTP pyrophosphatase MutT (NUDIX family)
MCKIEREVIKTMLNNYQPTTEKEHDSYSYMLKFLETHEYPFDRATPEGHFTASALILSHDRTHVLLLHHPKLKRWLQPGGHGEDTDSTAFSVALREAIEETNRSAEELKNNAQLIGIDVHHIPTHKDILAHHHLDMRFLFTCEPNQNENGENVDGQQTLIKWFPINEQLHTIVDKDLSQLIFKAQSLCK